MTAALQPQACGRDSCKTDFHFRNQLGQHALPLSIVAAVSVIASTAAALKSWSTSPPQYVDDGVIAFRLLDGLGYTLAFHGPAAPTAAYTPVMPLLLAGLHLVLGDGTAGIAGVLVFQGLVHVGAALLVYLIARTWLRGWGAGFAGGLVGLDPSLTGLATNWYHLDMRYGTSVFLMLLVTALLIRAWISARPSLVVLALTGAVCGLTDLCEATLVPFTAIATIALAWRNRRSRPHWQASLAFLGGAALVLAPWVVRNALVFETLVPVRSSAGLLFWAGNNPLATGLWADQESMADPEREPTRHGALLLGGHASTFNFRAQMTLPLEVRTELHTVDEVRRDRLLWRAALDWVWHNPGRFVVLTLRRAEYLAGGPIGTRAQRGARAAVFLAALIASLTIRRSGIRWIGALLLSWWAVFALMHCGYNDYRTMLDPFIILALVVAADRAIRRGWTAARERNWVSPRPGRRPAL